MSLYDIYAGNKPTSEISDLLRVLQHTQESEKDRYTDLEAIKQFAISFDSSVLLNNLSRVETIEDGVDQFLNGKIDLDQLKLIRKEHSPDSDVGEKFIVLLPEHHADWTLNNDADSIEETERALNGFFNRFMNSVRYIEDYTLIDEDGFVKNIDDTSLLESYRTVSEDNNNSIFTLTEHNPLDKSINPALFHAQKAFIEALELYNATPSYIHFRALQLSSVRYAEEIHYTTHLGRESVERIIAELQLLLNSAADTHDNSSEANVATIIMQSRALFGFGQFGELHNSKTDIRTTSNSLRLTAASLIDLVMIQNFNSTLTIEEGAIALEQKKISLERFITIVADNPLLSVTDRKSFKLRARHLKSSFDSDQNSLNRLSTGLMGKYLSADENTLVSIRDILDSYYSRFSDAVNQYLKKQKRTNKKRR